MSFTLNFFQYSRKGKASTKIDLLPRPKFKLFALLQSG